MQEDALERRIVTVLFADLVGFTTMSEQFDAEDVAAIQDRYFATVRDTVGRYGGRLEKFIGDAAMAVFGVPRSRDDDAERAVRAGVALVHAIEQLGASIGLDDDVLRLRVGINTGEVVTAADDSGESRVTGDTVNTAARLQTAAPPSGVLVGETTALSVAAIAELVDVPPLDLKGKAQPVSARLVSGFRSQPSRDEAMGALRAPTLGRERELATLEEAYARAAGGTVERWLIVAPPGVGKSRLLRELAERVAQLPGTPVVWRARARPDSVSPFDPVAGLLLDALGADRESAESTLADRLAAAGVGEARARVVTDACLALAWPVAAVGDAKPSEDRDALFRAWLEGMDALATDRTVIWLVEDVHWAGGDVLAFLDLAGSERRSGKGAGRLVVATARPSLLDAQPEWAAGDPATGRHVLQLETLAATDARSMVEALVGDALPRELVERIAERSDGNCLFIEELLRTWVSVGTLVADGSGWRLAIRAEEVALPASVQSIYAAQLDDLPPDARRLARRASVAGRRFPMGALAPLGVPDGDGLAPLRRRELIVGPVPEPIWGEAFAYRHALLRDAGYASLARAERARLHARLARWLEQAAGERSAEVAEQIATHYAAALESAPALAREVDEGLDRKAVQELAAEWYERAGQGTLALSAHDAARQLFRRSIDLTLEEAKLELARRWERLADATAFAADMDEGAAAYQKAMELYRGAMAIVPTGAPPEAIAEMEQGGRELEAGLAEARAGLARATAALSDVMYQQLQFADAKEMASRVIHEIGHMDPGSMARLLVAKAMGALGAAGPTAEAEADMEQALELARQSGDAQTELHALRWWTSLRGEAGKAEADDWLRLEQSAVEVGDWAAAIRSSINSALWRLDEDPSAVFELSDRARQLALAHGRTEDAGWADYTDAEACFASGDWDRAVAAGTRAVDLGEANAYLRLTVRTWHVLIPIAAVRGDRKTLERAARWYKGLEGKFEFPDSPYSRIIRAAQDVELAAHDLIPAYVPEVEPRIAAFADEPGGPSYSAALDRLLRAWLEAGEIEGANRAMAALSAAMPTFTKVSRVGAGTFELMRGRLAEAHGERGDAADAAQAALEHFRSGPLPWWMAKAIRLLERVDAADYELVSEAFEIERGLKAIAPTA